MRMVRIMLAAMMIGSSVGVIATNAAAAPTAGGREWRELYETTGLSWSQVASVCPTDGVSPCSGSVGGRNLSGWTWATADQALDLMDDYAPGLATAQPPVVSGIDGFWGAISFLGAMRWTTYTSLTYFYSEYTSGWTASTDPATGLPLGGGAGYSHALAGSTASGSIGVGTDNDVASSVRGVFLWRPAGQDYTPPTVIANVTGTLGSSGWYRSDVGVSWTVTDAESPIVSTSGCDASTIATDTAGLTLTCTATSAGFGGPGSDSVTVKRDATAPAVTCDAAPTYDLGQTGATVGASVADAMSGPITPRVTIAVSTQLPGTRTATVTGFDRAGNATSRQCNYLVVVPQCQGRTPTLLGTGGNDVLSGTARIDIIHGLAGNDTIKGLGKGDIICGGDGNDDLYGDGGNDNIDGGSGSDSIRGGDGADSCTSGEVRMSSCATLY